MRLTRGDIAPSQWRRHASQLLQVGSLLLLAAIAVGEIVLRSRNMLYSPDDLINIDAALTFLRTGDYTTVKWHSFPFDPAISSGILVTWIDGVVFLLGGNLFHARALRALAHLAIAVGLLFAFLRRSGLPRYPAATMALLVWLAAIVIPRHFERIVSPGETWGFLYLAAGVFFARSHPLVAAALWGAAIWLCKLIYMPFAAALLAAQVLALSRERSVGVRSPPFVRLALAQVVAFLTPLALWMAIIWLRHDFGTLARWCLSYVNFVFTHSTGVEVDLPGLANWRFAPGWPQAMSLLSYTPDITLPYLLPLVSGPLLFALHTLLRARGALRSTPREAYFLYATVAAIAAQSLWFFIVDPTQWGRHLMTAIYPSIALAIYCLADIWKQNVMPPRLGAVALACVGVLVASLSASEVLDYRHRAGWKMSYAATCSGLDLVHPPCRQDEARRRIEADCGENMTCIQQHRTELLGQAEALLEARPVRDTAPYTAGFMVIFLQHNTYTERDEFENALRPLLCAVDDTVFRSYLEAAGLDVAALLRGCASSSRAR